MTNAFTEREQSGAEPTAVDAAIRTPKLLATSATVGELRRLFEDDHVHAALLVEAGVLTSVIERRDLNSSMADDSPASGIGRLSGRIIDGRTSLRSAYDLMVAAGQRRRAVIDDRGNLVGLLCLKRSLLGFCSDSDVYDRLRERLSQPEGCNPS